MAFCDNKAIDFNPLRTPEAAAFMRYGEESVNEYTGVADISVPLYTIKCKDIEIPLVLRYDASGIKVEQEASWVGLGWNLMVGGCINYVCVGGHDMSGAPNIPNKTWTEYLTSEFFPWKINNDTVVRYRNKYYTYDANDNTYNWMSAFPYQPQNFVQSYNGEALAGGWGMKEYVDWGYGERDFYSVNILGKSFKFFIDPATVKVFYIGNAGEEFVVTPYFSGSNTGSGVGKISDVNTWEITDSNGYNYYFTVGDNTTEPKTGRDYHICWYLTKIQSALGDSVNFEYEEYKKDTRQTLNEYYSARFVHSDGEICCSNVSKDEYEQNFNPKTAVYATTHYLKKISTRNQTVTFDTSIDYGCSGKRLEEIMVETNEGHMIKDIRFAYGYFGVCDTGGNYAPKDPSVKSQNRLMLNNVKDVASPNTLTTSFEYNHDIKLPSMRSCAQDYWGYYNGKANKVGNKYTMIPTPNIFMSARSESDIQKLKEKKELKEKLKEGANRFSDGTYMQAAILKKITYPTGGYTTYEFEPNSCTATVTDSPLTQPINIEKSFEYKPSAPAGERVINNPYDFCLTQSLAYTLSVNYSGEASNVKEISVVIVSKNTGKSTQIPVKLSSSYVKVQEGTLTAGKYQLIIGAPSTGANWYKIVCKLEGSYSSSTPKTTKKINTVVGGLRIKKISNYDKDNDDTPINYTTYSYDGGILQNNIETIDYQKMYNDIIQSDPITGAYSLNQHSIDVYTITPGHSRMPAFYESFTPGIVGYSTVTKCKYKANDTKPEKKIVTSFLNNAPSHTRGAEDIEYYTILNNGTLLSQEIYNESDEKIARTEYTYGYHLLDHYFTNIIAKPKYLNIGKATRSAQHEEIQTIYNKDGSYSPEPVIEKLPSVSPANVFDVWRYPFILSRTILDSTTVIEYCPDGKTITRKKYTYNAKNHQVAQIDEFRIKDVKNGKSLTNQIHLTKIKYAVDEVSTDPKCKTMVQTYHRLNDVVETKKLLVENGKENCISTERTAYNGRRSALPISSSKSVGDAPLEIRAKYTYDGDCNIRSVTIDGNETIYIWSYNSQYPIAKIEGITFDDLTMAMFNPETAPASIEKVDSEYRDKTKMEFGKIEINKIMRETDTDKIKSFITTLRKKVTEAGGYVTTYTYKPLVGVTSETSPNGNTVYYEYDAFGRLKNVKDINYKTLKSYEYNYKK